MWGRRRGRLWHPDSPSVYGNKKKRFRSTLSVVLLNKEFFDDFFEAGVGANDETKDADGNN